MRGYSSSSSSSMMDEMSRRLTVLGICADILRSAESGGVRVPSEKRRARSLGRSWSLSSSSSSVTASSLPLAMKSLGIGVTRGVEA